MSGDPAGAAHPSLGDNPKAVSASDSRSTPRKRRTWIAIVATLLILVLPFIALPTMRSRVLGVAVDLVDRPAGNSTETVLFPVARGASAGEIAERLRAKGLIANPFLFRLLSRYYGISENLEAGEYELSPHMTMTDIMGRINRGLVRATSVTVPEGWRLEEIAQGLETKGIFPAADFRRATEGSYDFPFLPTGNGASGLEGYLFPDTYRVHPGEPPAELVRRMLEDFDRRVTPLTQGRQWPGGLGLHQAIVVASIVEREAALPEERPIIAAVFLNRLRAGMRLEADPTIQYAVAPAPVDGQPTIFWKNGLAMADKLVQSPYNTYKYAGLPPGPICNPGLASIKAVLEPAAVSYLFFVARGDGGHVFADTFDQHLENVSRYR